MKKPDAQYSCVACSGLGIVPEPVCCGHADEHGDCCGIPEIVDCPCPACGGQAVIRTEQVCEEPPEEPKETA